MSEPREDESDPPESSTLSLGRFPADPNARFSIDLNERTIGAFAALLAVVLM